MNDYDNTEYKLQIAIEVIKEMIKELYYCRTYGVFADQQVITKANKLIKFLEDKCEEL